MNDRSCVCICSHAEPSKTAESVEGVMLSAFSTTRTRGASQFRSLDAIFDYSSSDVAERQHLTLNQTAQRAITALFSLILRAGLATKSNVAVVTS